MSTPAVVFSLGFTYNWAIGGYDFLEYMDRPEAFDKTKHLEDEYKDFIDYMSNKEKSDGLFNADSDLLNEEDKNRYRELETVSRAAGCPKYYGVVSFDDNFLLENGIKTADGKLDIHRIKELGREGINAMISTSNKLDNDNVYWTGAIHTNTDNVHIHFSICEYERREDRCKVYRDKDCIEVKAFDKLKSKIVNRVLGCDYSKQLTELERSVIKADLGKGYSSCREQLIQLADKLPPEGGWQYGRPKMKPYRTAIDRTVDSIISSDAQLSDAWQRYNKMLDERTEYLRKIYGEGERHLYCNFKTNRIENFYKELGNQLLGDLTPIAEQIRASALPQAHPPENKKVSAFLPGIPDDIYAGYFDPSENEMPNSLYANYNDDKYDQQIELDAHLSEKNLDYDEQFFYNDDLVLYADEIDHPTEKKTESPASRIEWSKKYKLSLDYMYGKSEGEQTIVEKDARKALSLLLEESRSGNILATHDLGKLYSKMLKDEPNSSELSTQYYEKALQKFEELLKRHNSKWETSYLNYRIGKMYDNGLGTDQDHTVARQHYEAANDNKYAYFSLGNMYKYGTGVEIDMTKAVEFYQKAVKCKGGMPYASYALGKAYETGHGISADTQKAYKLYSSALASFEAMYRKNQDENLFYKIGIMYMNGQGTVPDMEKAEQYLLESNKSDNVYAKYALGKLYMTAEKLDVAKAENYLKQFIELDTDESGIGSYTLGKLYLMQDRIGEAEQLFIRSAASGNVYSAFTLGKMYMSEELQDNNKAEQYLKQYITGSDDQLGIGYYTLGKLYLTQDRIAEAEQSFIKSADRNNAYAAFALGRMYLTKDKQDHYKAEQYLKQYLVFSDDDLGIGSYTLGKLYLTQDRIDEAEQYLISSAEKENPYAAYKLGKLYLTEDRLDYQKAAQYLKISADTTNNEYAQYTLGKIYLSSECYDRDIAEKYLMEAAGQNNPYAQLRLAMLYSSENKYKQAEYWLKLSAQNGNDYAKQLLDNRIECRTAKVQLASTTNSVLRRLYSDMLRKTQQLLAEAERDEQEQKYKQQINSVYSR